MFYASVQFRNSSAGHHAVIPLCDVRVWLAVQAVAVRPQLRESAQHQAVIPDRVRHPPAPSHSPPRWDPGPSYEEALASASGPEKAAADLLPLDATFDPETHEGAGMSLLCCAVPCFAVPCSAVLRFCSNVSFADLLPLDASFDPDT